MKTIVTHHSPDLDGIPAIWLLKKFHPDFADARVMFTPAGTNLHDMAPDEDPEIVHVDTGYGKFDHHQSNAYTCGAQLVYEFLVNEKLVAEDDEALKRMIAFLTALDHGKDNDWPDPESDVYDFGLWGILNGWKMLYANLNDEIKYVEWVSHALNAIYRIMQSKVDGEKEFAKGEDFKTRWGKGRALATYNDGVLDLGIRRGYAVVVRKDPKKEIVRVTGDSRIGVDLTKAYEVCQEKDPMATWFLHASKVLLRNGSTRNPKMVASKLTLKEMIEILKQA